MAQIVPGLALQNLRTIDTALSIADKPGSCHEKSALLTSGNCEALSVSRGIQTMDRISVKKSASSLPVAASVVWLSISSRCIGPDANGGLALRKLWHQSQYF